MGNNPILRGRNRSPWLLTTYWLLWSSSRTVPKFFPASLPFAPQTLSKPNRKGIRLPFPSIFRGKLLNFGVLAKQKTWGSSNEEYVGIVPLPNSHQQDDYMCRIGDSYKHSYDTIAGKGNSPRSFSFGVLNMLLLLGQSFLFEAKHKSQRVQSSMIGFVWGSVWSFPLYWMHH